MLKLRKTNFQTKCNFCIYRKPDSLKQKNAFAPNFIHSLDSTHMMLTSLHCREEGITFVSVHDCFWTHACTVDIMNKVSKLLKAGVFKTFKILLISCHTCNSYYNQFIL